jgi:hypothetical protein
VTINKKYHTVGIMKLNKKYHTVGIVTISKKYHNVGIVTINIYICFSLLFRQCDISFDVSYILTTRLTEGGKPEHILYYLLLSVTSIAWNVDPMLGQVTINKKYHIVGIVKLTKKYHTAGTVTKK